MGEWGWTGSGRQMDRRVGGGVRRRKEEEEEELTTGCVRCEGRRGSLLLGTLSYISLTWVTSYRDYRDYSDYHPTSTGTRYHLTSIGTTIL